MLLCGAMDMLHKKMFLHMMCLASEGCEIRFFGSGLAVSVGGV